MNKFRYTLFALAILTFTLMVSSSRPGAGHPHVRFRRRQRRRPLQPDGTLQNFRGGPD